MKKTSTIIALLSVSGAFSIAASQSQFEAVFFQILFVLLSLLTMGIAFFILGGLPCKNLFREIFILCTRCLGFYAGGRPEPLILEKLLNLFLTYLRCGRMDKGPIIIYHPYLWRKQDVH